MSGLNESTEAQPPQSSNGLVTAGDEGKLATEPSTEETSDSKPELEQSGEEKSGAPGHGARFWVIFAALFLVGFQVSLESTIVTTAMPTVVRELDVGDNYVWVINAAFLAITVSLPLYAQMADLFGRRDVMLAATALFLLGTGIAGGAQSTGMLIGGRTIQGLGGGGMTLLIDIIVSDLVPLRQRAQFMGIVFFAVNLGTALGPFVGGQVVATTSWRWVFWLSLPITGAAAVLLIVFLRVPWRRSETALMALSRIDVVGNIVLMAATVAVLFGLTYAGTRYHWGDWHILVPLVLGLAGLVLFLVLQGLPRVCPYPVMPLRLFSHRTSAAAYALSFVYMMLSIWRLYFLPVYFQSTLLSSPARAGVQMLPSVLMLLPSVLVSGAVVKKLGRFLPVHIAGFALMLVGHGLLTILDQNSSTAAWVLIQMVVAIGSGIVITALLPAIQASLSDDDTAVAVGAWGFARAFGVIWGITVPATVFNNQFDNLADAITDPAARAVFSGGKAYQAASAELIQSFDPRTTAQIVAVYAQAIRRTWQVGIAFAGAAFLLVFLQKNLVLRDTLDTKYGLQEQNDAETANQPATAPRTSAEEKGTAELPTKGGEDRL